MLSCQTGCLKIGLKMFFSSIILNKIILPVNGKIILGFTFSHNAYRLIGDLFHPNFFRFS